MPDNQGGDKGKDFHTSFHNESANDERQ